MLPTARHHCDISLEELLLPDTMMQITVTRIGVIQLILKRIKPRKQPIDKIQIRKNLQQLHVT